MGNRARPSETGSRASTGPVSRPGPTGVDPAREWQHVLEDGSIDHEWITEGGITFCAQCEADWSPE